jgi:hypothetical protein
MDSEGRRLLQRVHQETEGLNIRPRAFQVDAVAGVFAANARSLSAPVTSLVVPVAVTPLVR